jgi:hypothetical protein
MAADPNAVEQVISRTLRDNLEKIQRTVDELHQAVNDMVAACASSRPSNTLPPMVRAQASAASLSATLEVLSRFVTAALQPHMQVPFGQDTLQVPSMAEPEVVAPEPVHTPAPKMEPPEVMAPPMPEPVAPVFSLDALPQEEQDLHRRAYRVAKVSMQDIKMLRAEDVRIGREKKDLCSRLRDDIEKAHKEYDRRFQSIQSHPVDYFYDWMVEILADGDAQALGKYPYSSPVAHG